LVNVPTTDQECNVKRRQFLQSSVAAAVALSFQHQFVRAAVTATEGEVASDINAIRLDGSELTLGQSAVQDFGESLRGNLLLPGSEAYDDARLLLNAQFNQFPALVVQPYSAADVSSAVRFAAENRLLTAVKCGGHAFAGTSSCDGGLQIDLSKMRWVRVDPQKKRAWISGGSLLGELDHETMSHGLATTAGSVSHTGVGGLTLGGGFGRLGRKYGLTIDNVVSADIVTADGELRHCSASENPDLFWAIRGGGGNFGVVTAFEFQLHEQNRQVVSGSYYFPFEEAQQVLEFGAEFAAQAPDELSVGTFFGAFPPDGEPRLSLSVVYSGPPEKAEEILAPIEKAGTVVNNSVRTWDYVALQKSGDWDDPRANGAHMASGFLSEMTPELFRDTLAAFEPSPTRATWTIFTHGGGAIGRVAPDATAFPHRDKPHSILSLVGWQAGHDPSADIAHHREASKAWKGHIDGFYTNDLADETQDEVDATYGANLPRLVGVKNQYDPTNLFRLNANIKPTV
jgi:FAD/FMN-containing dehydrogenase